LFSDDAEAGRRGLVATTYLVIPLNEECGLIEWVDDTIPYRSILLDLYTRHNLLTTNRKLKELLALSLPPKELFTKYLLPRYPALFYQWFIFQFSSPEAWYAAKLAFTHSMALFSVLGYIIGLGDRHGENILLHARSGACVHVDFNCLFEKGHTFDKPEKVPFRLTHNMVDAMGPAGHAGTFLAVGSRLLKILRAHRDLIYHTLETFIHDPLVEWRHAAKKGTPSTRATLGVQVQPHAVFPPLVQQQPDSIIENEEAHKILSRIDMKLKGNLHLDPAARYYVSEEAQMKELIKEATSIDNLAEMYVGWAPFM
jgi:serine/threonine-protein kinase ATR